MVRRRGNGRTFRGFDAVLILTLALFILVNFPALRFGLPYVYFWDEPGMMVPVLHALKTGNFNQFTTPQGTQIYDGYIHWVILGASFFHFLAQTGRGAIPEWGDLQFSADWDLEVSHPSFYLTGRLVILLSGLACLLLLYLVANRLAGKSIARLSVFILAVLPRFGIYSTRALPYVPMTLGVLLTAYLLLRYSENPSWKNLAAVGAAVALAASARVTYIILLIPAAGVLLAAKTPGKFVRLCVLAAISIGGEIAINFHQLLSFDLFMQYLHRLTMQAQVAVPEYADGVPGIEQLRHYLSELFGWFAGIGSGFIPLLYFAVPAVPTLLRRNRLRGNLIVWSVPVILLLQLLTIKYNRVAQICFLMPFAALLIAIGIANTYGVIIRAGELARRRFRIFPESESRRAAVLIAFGLIAILVLNPVLLADGLLRRHRIDTKDSRTRAMQWVADNAGRMETVVVAEELKVHPLDLRLLHLKRIEDYCRTDEFQKVPPESLNRRWMAGLLDKLKTTPEYVYRRPDLAIYFFRANRIPVDPPTVIVRPGGEITPDWLARMNLFQGYVVGYDYLRHRRREAPVAEFGMLSFEEPVKTFGTRPLFTGSISINPRVDIYRIPQRSGREISPRELEIDAPGGYFVSGDPVVLYRRGSVTIPLRGLAPGEYRLWLNARGERIRRPGPKIRIGLEGEDGETGVVIDDLEIDSRDFKVYNSKKFIVGADPDRLRLRIEFYYEDLQRQGRVLYLSGLFVERLRE